MTIGPQEWFLLGGGLPWAFLVWKTVSLARARGRDPWVWGVFSFFLSAPGWLCIPGLGLLIWLARSKPVDSTSNFESD